MIRTAFISAVLAAVLCITAAAEKITVDPNVRGNPPPELDEEPDLRLAEKVTVDCVNVRLHTALERISAKTGVTVRAGKNKSDWVVRDVPVLVCARDIQLGALLRGIADASHLLLTRSRIGDTMSYRVLRDTRRQRELDAFEETRAAAAQAAAKYDWDVLAQVKDLPESAFREHARGSPFGAYRITKLRAISNILAQLGPKARDRVLTGEYIALGLANAPESMKPHVKATFQSCWQSWEQANLRYGRPPNDPLDEQLSGCIIMINFGRALQYPEKLSILVLLPRGIEEIDHYDFKRLIEKQVSEFRPRPEVPKPKLELGDLGPEYEKLSLSGDDSPAFLDTKVKVAAPGDGTKPTYSDLLRGVSRATGYSILGEGPAARYRGTVMSLREKPPTMFDREITAREALEFGIGTRADGVDWYVDEEHKLIVGRDREWIKRLKALVPEKLLLELKAKLNGPGIELDDLEPLVELTRDQISEWIRHCPEFPEIEAMGRLAYDISGDSPWRLYFALSPSEKALAKSGDSVPLVGFDQEWLCRMLRRYVSRTWSMLLQHAVDPAVASSTPGIDTFTEPDALPELRLYVEKHERRRPSEGKRFYTMHIEERGTGELRARGTLSGPFPMHAPERKSEP